MAKETYFEHPPRGHVAILAYDSVNDRWQAVYVDASGRLQVDIAAAEQLESLVHGYIGGAWQKQPLAWGFSDTVDEYVANLDAEAGTNILDTTPVPAGEVHYITSIYGVNENTDPSFVAFMKRYDTQERPIHRETSPGAGNSVESRLPLVLKEGEHVRARFGGCVAEDDIKLTIIGYKMDIDL